ncbi:MAG: cyanophycin synthetase [Nitriliruptoraceae bacterium]
MANSTPEHDREVAAAFERAVARLGSRGPGRMVPDLSRITALTGLLGDPQLAYPSVQVTGTNGKGSTTRMLGALCAAAGISAGTYTSPHLQTVRERLSIAGHAISPRRFTEIHDEVATIADLVDQRAQEEHGVAADHVTYFELLTAMATRWFADAPVDVGVFEVGMGGRWDATNLVRGEVAVLGPIDVDHPELGRTPREVATEKVGIIKPGAQVVTAVQDEEVDELIDATVAGAGATRWRVGEDVGVVERGIAVGGQLLTLRVGDREIDEVVLPLFGAHQADNAALALGAFAALTGEAFARMDDDVVRHGLGAVTAPGRLEIVHREPTVLLDGAHNPHGARAAAAALGESFAFDEVVLVAACLEDKDIEAILAAFRGTVSHVIVTRAPSPRAASVERMRTAALDVWGDAGLVVEAATDIASALALATEIAGASDAILVAGSLYTVGAARDRYLPLDDALEDEIVIAPEDEEDDEDDTEVADLRAALADDAVVAAAIAELEGEHEDSGDADEDGRDGA